MGASESEHGSDDSERPQHQVTVPDFWIGKYQVTQEQWETIMSSNPSRFKEAKRPVEWVDWRACQEFCRKLSERTEKRYRLPGEAEWEYACRAGTTTPFSSGETLTTDFANYAGDFHNCTYADEGKGQRRGETVEVGIFPPNSWGLYDMHGNVWELCEEGWHNDYNGAPTDGTAWTDNHSQANIGIFVFRGGSWKDNPQNCRSAKRGSYTRNGLSLSSGLRLVLGMN
jgi:formylglycine-generating enzyme required for sulfatase activity